METYEWQKNKAVVDRLYYSERIFVNSTLFMFAYSAVNLLFIKKNYFPELMLQRIFKVHRYWAIGNALALFILLRPLTKDEIAVQWRKRQVMGKWLYSLFHLEPIEEGKNH